jgi:Zinc dependent phospholipase C
MKKCQVPRSFIFFYMKNHSWKLIFAISALLLAPSFSLGWGVRGHNEINRAAIRALPAGELDFLKAQEPWIVYLSIIPDTYRTQNEPFLKIFEDPNHGWFIEQSADLMKSPPRSRYEFIIALYQDHLRTKDNLTNVRWTGTLPYAAVEHFERMQAAMRRLRAARKVKQEGVADTRFIEQEIATYIGLLGHYIGDGAMPLHDSIHHDGWQGDNPKNFTRDRTIHGRMESRFVELIQAKAADFAPRIGAARIYVDPFAAIVKHLLDSAKLTEKVYEIDLKDKWADAKNEEARGLVYKQLAAGAETLRNLLVTAWARSSETRQFDPENNPINPNHPKYNPATGSAPAP